MRKTKIMFPLVFTLFLLNACTSMNTSNENNDVLYTTIYPIQFIVEELVDDEVDVVSVYPPGVDAHSYDPTTREMLEIANGNAFIYLGAGMESFAESVESTLKPSDVEFIEVGEHQDIFMPADHDATADHHEDIDPHIWFDPQRMVEVSKIIKTELIDIFPNLTETIEENDAILKEQFMELDQQYQTVLNSKTERHIVVSHAAYQYWEDRYGMIQIPISGLTAEDEPSQKELAHITQFTKKEDIQYVLYEKNASNKLATIIQEHIAAEPLYIHNLEVLVDEDIENNEDYFSIMEENLTILNKATK